MADFLLYGSTGYTGDLIARTAVQQGWQPMLAGRSADKLAAQAVELGLDYCAFALDDPAAVDAALANTAVVLNCAGPLARTARPLAESCLRSQTHYLDLAGEVPEFEALVTWDAEAKAAGVMLLPGVGFGVVPSDCLAAHLKHGLPSATWLTLAFQTEGGVSQGTLMTMMADLHRQGVARRKGSLTPVSAAWKRRQIDFGHGPVPAITNPWRGDVSTAYYSTGIPNIDTYMVFPAPLPVVMKTARYLGWLWGSTPFQNFLQRQIQRQPAGPTQAERAGGQTILWGEVADDSGQKRVARLHGPEAYTFTAQTALAVVKKVLAGQVLPGFQTPSRVYGADFVLELNEVRREDLN